MNTLVSAEGVAATELKPGEPCGHPGCLSYISHPCEGCGRIEGLDSEQRLKESMLIHSGDVYASARDKIRGWQRELAKSQ